MAGQTLKKFLWVIKIIATLLFVMYVNRSIDRNKIAQLATHFDVLPLLFTLILSIIGQFLQLIRWKIILSREGFTTRDSVITFFYGNLLAFITPGRMGELFRAVGLDKKRRPDTVMAVLIDKIFIILTILFIGIICSIVQKFYFNIAIDKNFILLTLIGFSSVFVLIGIGYWRNHLNGSSRIIRLLHRIFQYIPTIHTRDTLILIGLSLSAHVVLIFQTLILLHMFGISHWLMPFISIAQAYAFMTFLPFFFWNLGIREHSFSLFLSQHFHYFSPEKLHEISFGASFAIFIMNLMLPAAAGLIIFLFTRKISSSKIPDQ